MTTTKQTPMEVMEGLVKSLEGTVAALGCEVRNAQEALAIAHARHATARESLDAARVAVRRAKEGEATGG